MERPDCVPARAAEVHGARERSRRQRAREEPPDVETRDVRAFSNTRALR